MSKPRATQDGEKIRELLTRGVAEVIEREHLEDRLKRGDKLRVKFGIDPTAPILHLGHAVPLRLLRRFQDLGHTVILLIGDFTARIGDPTGRVESRPPLTDAEIQEYMKTYVRQVGRVIDVERAEVRYNNEWLGKMSVRDTFLLASKVTYGQTVAREDFKRRIREDIDFTLSEFMYPLFQGYDSVALRADVEVGGTDQKFNLLMGRRIQKRYEQKPQDIITVPLLVGLDGEKKMSKSEGNFIALEEEPLEMYGKLMSIPDALVRSYFELLTNCSIAEADAMLKGNPRDAKMRLAREIVAWLHSAKVAELAEAAFVKTFQKHEAPDEVKSEKVKNKKYRIVDLLMEVGLATSKSDARRTIEQKGVKVDGRVVDDPDTVIEILKGGVLIQKGKRHFVRVVSS